MKNKLKEISSATKTESRERPFIQQTTPHT